MDKIISAILENFSMLITAVVAIKLLIFVIEVVIIVLIIRMICRHMAKQNARAFEYEYLAECIVSELRNSYTESGDIVTEDTSKEM